jgi:large subunit ribosomal protein L4
MEVDVLNMKGKKVDTVELPSEIFDAPVNIDLMHQAYVRQLANSRLGTHSTKGRSEVRGGGRKPWRQKGTGRARQGSIRAAQWVGGGKIHTPKPRDYEKKMPRKMRRAALRSALSLKAAANAVVVVDELKVKEPKTKIMAEALGKCVGESSILILIPEKSAGYQDIELSARNLPEAKTLLVNYLNVRDILGYDRILLPVHSLEKISAHLSEVRE